MRELKQLDVRCRHKLRIGIKKLRYATEFFDSLFGGSKSRRKKLADLLEELQESLGRLNDFSVHRKLAGNIVHQGKHRDRRRPEKAFAMGIVTGNEQAQFKALINSAIKAGERIAKRATVLGLKPGSTASHRCR